MNPEEFDPKKVDLTKYEGKFSEEGFWSFVKKYATKVGIQIVYNALKLFYCYKSPNTPTWAKSAIIGALGYLISPIDVIPDVIPVVGFADDAGVLLLALAAVALYIDGDVNSKAKQKLADWFGADAIAELNC